MGRFPLVGPIYNREVAQCLGALLSRIIREMVPYDFSQRLHEVLFMVGGEPDTPPGLDSTGW